MQKCCGFCCYDGVYLKSGEEEKLRQIIIEHPNDFNLPVDDYFMDGNWQNRVKGRKTAIKKCKWPHNFPKHFNQTKCIFADDQGLCILQKIAIREKIHPWTYKPLSCCLFPLTLKSGKLTPPPLAEEQDDYYVDDNYPGFINCLYCGQDCLDGDDWQNVLKDEIEYFNKNNK